MSPPNPNPNNENEESKESAVGPLVLPNIVVKTTFAPNPFETVASKAASGSNNPHQQPHQAILMPVAATSSASTDQASPPFTVSWQPDAMQIDSPLGSPRALVGAPPSPTLDAVISQGIVAPPPQQHSSVKEPDEDDTTIEGNVGELSTSDNKTRRQKRLERNRESARLSRRRRKQYLEVLEERVHQLSHEMDRGRRAHVAGAVATVHTKRLQAADLGPHLYRSSNELKVAATFGAQQLASFCTPAAHHVTLWLTLQNDDFFRGGRAASERLSAARIGERMFQNGNDKVTPSQTMWPLICNEIGLSYDQEEKVRLFQRSLLQSPETWLSRHASFAAQNCMKTSHEATQALALATGNREQRAAAVLNSQQRSKLAQYVASQREQIKARFSAGAMASSSALVPDVTTSGAGRGVQATGEHPFEISKSQHVAANLYILNHRLSQILKKIPSAAPLVTGPALKKLSRRPSFESLGARSGEKGKILDVDNGNKPLNRNSSFASTGSLKRSASEMSMDSDNAAAHRPSFDPMEAQASAQETIQSKLGHVKPIMPATKVPVVSMLSTSPQPEEMMQAQQQQTQQQLPAEEPVYPMSLNGQPLPDPVPVSVLSVTPAPAQMLPLLHPPPAPSVIPTAVTSSSTAVADPGMAATHEDEPEAKQRRSTSSFFPPALGVVPEEIWSAEAAEDFLMSFADEDWAIGEGVEMDLP